MFRKFLPTKVLFFDLFEQHAALIVEAAQKFYEGISHEGGINDLSSIKILEHQADLLTQKCLESLHKTFITPIDRDQIYSLIKGLDDIIDSIDEANDAMRIYKIHKATPEYIRLAELLVQSTRQIEIGVKGLRRMGEGALAAIIHKEIHRLEHEADEVLTKAIGNLFDEEKDARQIIKWKDLYEILENSTDQCAAVADLIEGIFLENE